MEQFAWEIGETAHALRRAIDRRAAASGVTRAQWRVLAHLRKRPGLRQVELAERMDVEPITLCRIVDRLQENELVERRRDPNDRRAWQLFLTDRAGPVCAELEKMADSMFADAFAGLQGNAIEAARQLLAKVRENLSEITSAKVSA